MANANPPAPPAGYRPEDFWGEWHCPLCTFVIAINPYVVGGMLEREMHTSAHVEANDDYLMGLV